MISQAAFTELVDAYFDLRNRLAVLERDISRSFKPGRVHEVDPTKGVRLDFGPDDKGEPKLSAWLPYPEQGGEAKTMIWPTKGQILTMVTPVGSDTRKAFLMRGGFCDDFEQPTTDPEEMVLIDFGDVRITARRNELKLRVGTSIVVMKHDRILATADLIATIGPTKLGLKNENEAEQPFPKVQTTLGEAIRTFAKVGAD